MRGAPAVPPLNLPPGWGETFRAALRVDSCLRRNDGGGCAGMMGAREWRSCEQVLGEGRAGLDDVEGVCSWLVALVPLGWLELAAVVEVGAY